MTLNSFLRRTKHWLNCILNDPEACSDSVSQSLLDELPSLRLKADKAIGFACCDRRFLR